MSQAAASVVVATPTWSLNGVNIFAASLVRGLIARGMRAHILLTRTDWNDRKPMVPPTDIPFEALPVPRFASCRTRWQAMVDYLKRRAPCLYVPNHDFGHSCVSPMLSSRVLVVGIVHSDDPQHYEHARRLAPYWNAIVAVSKTIRDTLVADESVHASRVSVIPYGVEVPATAPARARAAGQPLRLIYAGRIDQPQKRVLDLPLILKALRARGVSVRLTVAGGGRDAKTLAQLLEREGVGSDVEWTGIVSHRRILELLGEHDVFVLTSAYEGMSLSLLEAMAQGCVPVVSDVQSGTPELITDGLNGYRVPIGDVDAFAGRLEELQRNPEQRARMADRAYQAVARGAHAVDAMVDRYAELFDQVIREHATGGYRRPRGPVVPPPGLPLMERLPAFAQAVEHHVVRLLKQESST